MGNYFAQVLGLHQVEGRLADDQLVDQDADRPQVNLFIVILPRQQLGREVQRSAAEGRPHFRVVVDCPAEVADLHIALS